MADVLNIALAQINPLVGDVDGNVGRILARQAEARERGADLVVFTELVVEGYTPEDMILKPAFQETVEEALAHLAAATAAGPAMLVGAMKRDGGRLFNAAYLLAD